MLATRAISAVTAATRRDPQWPDNARVAVQFVVNFEEGGENNILHGDRASEAFLSDVLGAQPWPGQRHANIESMFEYGSRAGFWRLWRMFNERKLPTTVFGVATALKRNPEIVAAMKESGWDIASHSLKWIEHKDMTGGAGARRDRRVDPRPHRGDGLAAARLVHRALLDQHQPPPDGGGRLPLSLRLLCRRSALLGQGRERQAAHHSLYA